MDAARRTDMIDIIIPSLRGAESVTKILKEAAEHPDLWMRHRFIILFNDDQNIQTINKWVAENRPVKPLPLVTVAKVHPSNVGDLTAIRQQGIDIGFNPFVYFQDDDDILPKGLEERMRMMEDSEWMAIYGVTDTVSTRGQLIERFPAVKNGNFQINPQKGARLFPTYPHPISALFKREIFEKAPFYDGKKYYLLGAGAFLMNILAQNIPIQFLPDTVRTVTLHDSNDTGILAEEEREAIARDIQQWQTYVHDPEVKEFQAMIIRRLMDGRIGTYKEIDSLVEDQLELF